MTKTIDRQLIFSYVKAYLVCLVSLLSLFIVVDLFTNLDNFWEQHKELGPLARLIGVYYASKSIVIFDRLSEAIVLLAAMFTVAWMQRNNEILPLLSAGVSTRRIVRPVLFAAFAMVSLAVLNQELLLPQVDPYLVEFRNDDVGDQYLAAKGGYESNGILISGARAQKRNHTVHDFKVVFPNQLGFEGLPTLNAKKAHYYAPGAYPGRDYGGWLLVDTSPAELPGAGRKDILDPIVPGKFFLRTTEIDFNYITRPKNWAQFVPTVNLLEELGRVDHNRLATVAVMFHTRLTRPILGILLTFMGLAIILRDQNRHMFVSAGLCLVVCVIFFLVSLGFRFLGDYEHLHPILAAWIPVFLFGPLAFVMFDAVHT